MNLRLTVIGVAITPHISAQFFLGNPGFYCRFTINTADLHRTVNFAAASSYLRLPQRATDGDEVQVNDCNIEMLS